jgi:O-antigen/teichoic acid export membrane protein
MSNKLFNTAKKNALTSYVNFFLNALMTLLYSPYLVHFLGAYDFGILNAIRKFLGFASVADGRATQALKWVIANKKDEDDDLDKQKAVGSALKVWVYFLPFFFVLIGILVYSTPHMLKNLHPADVSMVRLTAFILAANIFIYPLLGIPDAVLVGINAGHKSMTIQTFWMVISNILVVVVAWLGYGIIGIALVILGITFANGISVYFICKKNAKWFAIKKPDPQQVKEFVNFSLWTLIWATVARLLTSSETILLGTLAGPREVTNFTLTAYITQMGITIGANTSVAVLPGLGSVMAQNDNEKAVSIVKSTREIIFFLAIFMGACIIAFNKAFIFLWIGPKFYMGELINTLMVLCMVQLIVARNEGQIQDISLDIKKKVTYGLISTVSGMVLAAVLYKITGSMMTIFLGLMIGRAPMGIIFSSMVNRMLNLKKTVNVLQYVFGALILGLGYLFSYFYSPKSWLLLVLYTGAGSAVILVACYFLLLKKASREVLMKKLLKRKTAV